MKIIVLAKQVPDTNQVRIDPVKNTLIREGVPNILNPDDASALEAALQIKNQFPDTHITVVSMGPLQAKGMLQECLAMGADEAVLLNDSAFSGSDTWATSNALAAAVRKIGNYDLVLAGRQAIDGDTAQVGPQVAEKLDIPQVTYVAEVICKGKTAIQVKRIMEDGYELLELKTPCLLTVMSGFYTARYMTVQGILNAVQQAIPIWSAVDVDVKAEEIGLAASPTIVIRSFTLASKSKGIVVHGDNPQEQVTNLIDMLKDKKIV